MIDWHSHILPGMDDGPAKLDESLAMARAMASFGFTDVFCTPHCIRGSYEPMPLEVRHAVGRLQLELEGAGISLRLHAGMEYYLDECFVTFADNLQPLGRTRLVLCESPPQAPPGLVAEAAGLIVSQGYIPLIAHPERSDVIWQMIIDAGREPDPADASTPPDAESPGKSLSLWERLFGTRRSRQTPDAESPPDFALLPEVCLFQANLGSFTGFYGGEAQRRAYELLQRGGYHCFASDLHDSRSAPEILESSREKVMYNPALRRLLEFVPPAETSANSQLAFW